MARRKGGFKVKGASMHEKHVKNGRKGGKKRGHKRSSKK